jgi:hypothetical protein
MAGKTHSSTTAAWPVKTPSCADLDGDRDVDIIGAGRRQQERQDLLESAKPVKRNS